MPTAPTETAASPLPGERVLPRGGRVLLVRLSALGDVLFALETVAALHRERPDVHIDFLVEDRFAALLAGHPQLDRVLVYPRRRRLSIPGSLLALRRRRYDVVLDVHGILKSAAHVGCARAGAKVGAAAPASREGAARSYDLVVPMPDPPPHRADIGHRLLAAIGLSGQPAPPVLAAVPPPAELFAGLATPRVLLHPGTSAFAEFKRWPAPRFAELARRLAARGLGVLVGYGPGERDLAAPALAAAPQSRAVDGGALGLLGFAGVMARCAVVVAADTGPLHLAAAMGARCVALFGPKDPLRYGPRAHGAVGHEVLFHDVPCRPCRRRDCVTPQCVLGIAVDEVEAAVLRQVAREVPA
ncbi:MAG: glycosyltransferase family 9 protein [Planctomycetes bacterium]|nr:glycosyltransferase family 9 protein [Planctomycetota bacterium]